MTKNKLDHKKLPVRRKPLRRLDDPSLAEAQGGQKYDPYASGGGGDKEVVIPEPLTARVVRNTLNHNQGLRA